MWNYQTRWKEDHSVAVHEWATTPMEDYSESKMVKVRIELPFLLCPTKGAFCVAPKKRKLYFLNSIRGFLNPTWIVWIFKSSLALIFPLKRENSSPKWHCTQTSTKRDPVQKGAAQTTLKLFLFLTSGYTVQWFKSFVLWKNIAEVRYKKKMKIVLRLI